VMRAIVLLCLLSAPAAAQQAPVTLRFGAVAPDGTAWARVGRSFAQNVEQSTGGEVRVKWYLGGIAGDDVQMAERLRRGQLDGAAGANMLCQRLAPSMRVLQLAGFYRDRDEWTFVRDRLRPLFDEELKRAGFVDLGLAGIGPSVIVSRTPVTNLADLKRMKLWVWDASCRLRSPTPGASTRTAAPTASWRCRAPRSPFSGCRAPATSRRS
jgi:TRAP-type C4-dicarboxylate transport system substrate-binding protein